MFELGIKDVIDILLFAVLLFYIYRLKIGRAHV